jgi:hypothetical protein
VTADNEIAERMTAEAKGFAEFMQKANDSEKAHLRLEVDKLRRAEAEWLQIMTHVFDHVYALYAAAAKSGQPNLATTREFSNCLPRCRAPDWVGAVCGGAGGPVRR